MKDWLRKAGGLLKSGTGAGLLTTAAGLLTGESGTTTLGLQLTTAGLVKMGSKAAGREIHRLGAPLASLAVLAGARAAGMDMPIEVAAAAGADPHATSQAVQFIVNGLLPGGLQTTTKHATRAVGDFVTKRAW